MQEKACFTLHQFEGVYQNDVFPDKKNKSSPQYHPGPFLLPPYFSEIEEKVVNLKVRPDDVWLISFPRTGSTWLQEIVWLIGNDLNFQKAATTLQQIRAPLLEASTVLFEYVKQNKDDPNIKLVVPRFYRIHLPAENGQTDKNGQKNANNDVASTISKLYADPVGYVNDLPSPRFIKSHLAFHVLPREISTVRPKIIYILRNPKDVCISYYFHCRLIHQMDVEFEYFCELFLNDLLPIGSLWNHYFGFWNRKNEPNLLVLKYEDLKKDTKSGIRTIAKFLEKPLTDGHIESMIDYLSVDKMKKNKACNLEVLVEARQGKDIYERKGIHFIRKGIVGDHKNYMSPEMNEKFDRWIEKNTRGTDLTFLR